MRVKIFSGSKGNVEKDINRWLDSGFYSIKDLKQSESLVDGEYNITVTIVYGSYYGETV